MKLRINAILLGLSILMTVPSCIKKDNYPGPDASLEGNLFQDGTASKTNIQVCSGNLSIRLEQLSWNATPAPQDIPVKYDGTYQNTKLFKGHYRVSIKGGAFWPVAPVEMDISNVSHYDFQLTPYLLVNNIKAELNGTTLTVSCNLDAPIGGGIPTVTEIQPFVNTTKIVGPGASIFDFSDVNKLPVNKDWEKMSVADKSPVIDIPNLVAGRTFFVRLGVRYNNDDKSYNLSDIIQVDVPKN
jgi:Domain of unknown function (DUF3823_C)/Protein of unknown function (DUF3823) N-terminal domain